MTKQPLKILSRPKGNAEEYGRWACNPYKGCSNGCEYCYLHSGPMAKGLGGNKPVLKEGIVNEDHAYHLAMAEIIAYREEIKKAGGLFMTFTSDPCIEATRGLFFRIIGSCVGDNGTPDEEVVPVMLLTKNADFMPKADPRFPHENNLVRLQPFIEYVGRLYPEELHDRLAFGFTLTGHDELEPNASPNLERVAALKWLHQHDYRTWASIEPVVDFDSAYNIIQDAFLAGCEHFKIGLMTKNTRVCKSMFDKEEAVRFINNVMALVEGTATVYWKQSFYDFFGDEPIHGCTPKEYIMQFAHSVDKDWSMFKK